MPFVRRAVLICFLALLGVTPARAQTASAPSPDGAPPAALKPYFIVLPIVYYTPETRVAGGAAGLYNVSFDAGARNTRTSTIGFIGIYTQNKQVDLEIQPDLYTAGDRYGLEGSFKYLYMPQDYYGIGPHVPNDPVEKLTPRTLGAMVLVKKQIARRLFLGVRYEIDHTNMEKVQAGGVVASGSVMGSGGGTVAGLGAVLMLDTRDNVQFPRRGQNLIATFNRFATALGGDYAYSEIKIDYRKYWSVGAQDVVAAQVTVDSMSGDVPFYRLAQLGGSYLLRGYYYGQYRDRALWVAQGEYRKQIWKRIGAAVFAGAGGVCDGLSACRAQDTLPIAGAGFRFKIDKKGGTNFRMDLAFGRGSSGVYFTVQEAF